MRHRKVNARFGRDEAHRKAMLANMAMALLKFEKIETTLPRAKELRRKVERLITMSKKDSVHARRLIYSVIRDRSLVKKLFAELAPRYLHRPGGYTRIIRTGNRVGDCAPMSVIELVKDKTISNEGAKEGESKAEAKV